MTMIEWTGINSEELKLSILGYEFPSIEEDYDANWLIVEVEVSNELGKWKRQSPCILTWELQWLSKWLLHVVNHEAKRREIGFLEQDINNITYLAKVQNLHCFAILLAPRLTYDPQIHDYNLVVVRLTDDQVNKSISVLDQFSREFPPRGQKGQTIAANESLGPQFYADDDL